MSGLPSFTPPSLPVMPTGDSTGSTTPVPNPKMVRSSAPMTILTEVPASPPGNTETSVTGEVKSSMSNMSGTAAAFVPSSLPVGGTTAPVVPSDQNQKSEKPTESPVEQSEAPNQTGNGTALGTEEPENDESPILPGDEPTEGQQVAESGSPANTFDAITGNEVPVQGSITFTSDGNYLVGFYHPIKDSDEKYSLGNQEGDNLKVKIELSTEDGFPALKLTPPVDMDDIFKTYWWYNPAVGAYMSSSQNIFLRILKQEPSETIQVDQNQQTQQTGGFGLPNQQTQQTGGFGRPNQQTQQTGGFGTPNQQTQQTGGFGTQNQQTQQTQQTGGFGALPQHPGGFGTPNQQTGGFGALPPPQGTIGLSPATQSFGSSFPGQPSQNVFGLGSPTGTQGTGWKPPATSPFGTKIKNKPGLTMVPVSSPQELQSAGYDPATTWLIVRTAPKGRTYLIFLPGNLQGNMEWVAWVSTQYNAKADESGALRFSTSKANGISLENITKQLSTNGFQVVVGNDLPGKSGSAVSSLFGRQPQTFPQQQPQTFPQQQPQQLVNVEGLGSLPQATPVIEGSGGRASTMFQVGGRTYQVMIITMRRYKPGETVHIRTTDNQHNFELTTMDKPQSPSSFYAYGVIAGVEQTVRFNITEFKWMGRIKDGSGNAHMVTAVEVE